MSKIKLLLSLIVIAFFSQCTSVKKEKSREPDANLSDSITTFTDDGAWCWFSNPRAIYYSENEIITGWVKKDGSIEAASLNLSMGEKQFNNLNPGFQFDDHDNPAFAVLPDGNLFVAYSWHSTQKGIVYHVSSNGGDIQSFGENIIFKPNNEELLKKFPRESYTYANPFVLKEEDNRLFVFGRWIGFKPNLIISDDLGKSWSQQYVVISDEPFDAGNRPYVNYYSDGKSKIHLIFTDGHPRDEPFNSVYYCYYEKGSFWNIDGEIICTLSELPFKVEDASLVYRATVESGRAWVNDIVVKDGKPVILYTRLPAETDHRYYYAWYNRSEKKWEDHKICDAGKWFPQTPEGEVEREPHYMGNLTLQPSNPDVVYLSRQVNKRFEIEKYKTLDGGKNWEITPITSNSEYDQVRPYVPRNQSENAKTVVLWMENKKYIHYTNFDSRIKYFIDSK